MPARLVVLAAIAGLATVSPAAAAPEAFVRPRIDAALFTHEHTALLAPECGRIATWLARHAAATLTDRVLAGDAAAIEEGRRLLALALHLEPGNAAAVQTGLRWTDGKRPELPPPAENLRVFSDFLVSAAARTPTGSGTAVLERHALLGRFLVAIAADADPDNSGAVAAAERQARRGKGPPWRALVAGRLGTTPPQPARR